MKRGWIKVDDISQQSLKRNKINVERGPLLSKAGLF